MSSKPNESKPAKAQASSDPLFDDPRLAWMKSDDIRPYVFVRPENRVKHPGVLHSTVDWFPHKRIYKNPLRMSELAFADRILRLEAKAFAASNMAMPRWVFYDCAIVPGFVAGFAARASSLPEKTRRALLGEESAGSSKSGLSFKADVDLEEWVPLSLFIIIPTMSHGEWVAHNLCSVNSILSKDDGYYGIGFLSKAFGLWYANVRSCCGMTQWTSPAVRLHAHYGDFEVLTAYTPVHSYPQTLTYRLEVDPSAWRRFFEKNQRHDFGSIYTQAGFDVDPRSEASLIAFQKRLEGNEGPYYIDGKQTLSRAPGEALTVYRKK